MQQAATESLLSDTDRQLPVANGHIRSRIGVPVLHGTIGDVLHVKTQLAVRYKIQVKLINSLSKLHGLPLNASYNKTSHQQHTFSLF